MVEVWHRGTECAPFYVVVETEILMTNGDIEKRVLMITYTNGEIGVAHRTRAYLEDNEMALWHNAEKCTDG